SGAFIGAFPVRNPIAALSWSGTPTGFRAAWESVLRIASAKPRDAQGMRYGNGMRKWRARDQVPAAAKFDRDIPETLSAVARYDRGIADLLIRGALRCVVRPGRLRYARP